MYRTIRRTLYGALVQAEARWLSGASAPGSAGLTGGAAAMPTPPCRAVLTGHAAWVVSLAAVGPMLGSASYDCTVRVWHTGGSGEGCEGGEGGEGGGGGGGGGGCGPS